MSLDMVRITAALNAYPWTSGALTMRDGDNAWYCSVGLLLRYAGVAQAEIECAGLPHVLMARYGELLESEYGITEVETITAIIHANDLAASHEKAIEQVQFVLAGVSIAELFASQAGVQMLSAEDSPIVEDEDGGCGALVG